MTRRASALFVAVMSMQLALHHIQVAQAEFFVCPAPCQAMMLPRDMESLEDCLCSDKEAGLLDNYRAKMSLRNGRSSLFTCPDGSIPRNLAPLSFADCDCLEGYTRDDTHKQCTTEALECIGRYRLKPDVDTPESIEDCDCVKPYKKDDDSGRCQLTHCPHAGNYVRKKHHNHVTSLADCGCVKPYIKNEQSGECMKKDAYQCPRFSSPRPYVRPQSFRDCECEFGYVATHKNTCVHEVAHYSCPRNAMKRSTLPADEVPRSFVDCVCIQEGLRYRRDDDREACVKIKKKQYEERFDAKASRARDAEEGDDDEGEGEEEGDSDEDDEDFECPPFSTPLAPYPHSVNQCDCVRGYGWKLPEKICVRTSMYQCPRHAYKNTPHKRVEESFRDCACARGYYRDDTAEACLEWYLTNDNGCPSFAFLKHWPLQSKANCQCVYGLNTSASEENVPIRESNQNNRRPRKLKPECNRPPLHLLATKDATFAQCPEKSFATSWPLSNILDCTCEAGYDANLDRDEEFDHGDGIGFRCVPIEEEEEDGEGDGDGVGEGEADVGLAAGCRSPLVLNKLLGDCMLPVEEVVPSADASKKDTMGEGSIVFKGIEYDYVLTEENVMIIQGDIAIGELKAWDPTKLSAEHKLSEKNQPYSYILHGYYNSERDHRWQNGRMCYELDMGAAAFEQPLQDAMKHITNVTGFEFHACAKNMCATDKACAHDYVSVQSTPTSCWSYIGRIGGKQTLGVSSDCGVGNLMHVLLHAVGLHHTIDRMDRDDHVRIAWECIPAAKRSNFVTEDINMTMTNGANDEVPYDFFSIMHHPSNAFVHSGKEKGQWSQPPSWCQSIIPIIADPEDRVEVIKLMGQRFMLSRTDIHAVWRLYPKLKREESLEEGKQVHKSRLHTPRDAVSLPQAAQDDMASYGATRSWGRKLASSIGALVTLCGFFAFVAFAVLEFQRRSLRGKDNYYGESLLADKSAYD